METSRKETISESSSESSSESESELELTESSGVEKEKGSETSTSESVDEKPTNNIDTVVTPIIEKESPLSETSDKQTIKVHTEIPFIEKVAPSLKESFETIAKDKESSLSSSSESEADEPKPVVESQMMGKPQRETISESSSSSSSRTDVDKVVTLVIEKESPSESSEEETTRVHSEISLESEAEPEGKTKEEIPSLPEIPKNGEFPSSSSEAEEPKPEVEIPVLKIPQRETKSESSSSFLDSKADEPKEEVQPPVTEVTKDSESEYEKKGSCNMTPTVDVSKEEAKSSSSLSSGPKTKDLKPNVEDVTSPEKEIESDSCSLQSETEPNLTKSPDVEKEKGYKTSTSVSEDEKPTRDIDAVVTPIIEKESFEEETTSVHPVILLESEAEPEGKIKEEVPSLPEIPKNGEFPSSLSEADELESEVGILKLKTPQSETKSESSSSFLESKAEVEPKEEVPPPVTEVTKDSESEYEKKGSCNMIPVKEIKSESSSFQSKSEPDPTKSPDVEKEKDSKTLKSVSEDDKPSQDIDTVISPIVEKETSEKETTNVHSEIPLQTEEEPEEKPKEEILPPSESEVEEQRSILKTPETETKSESSSSPSESKAKVEPKEDRKRANTDTSLTNHSRKKNSRNQQVKRAKIH